MMIRHNDGNQHSNAYHYQMHQNCNHNRLLEQHRHIRDHQLDDQAGRRLSNRSLGLELEQHNRNHQLEQHRHIRDH